MCVLFIFKPRHTSVWERERERGGVCVLYDLQGTQNIQVFGRGRERRGKMCVFFTIFKEPKTYKFLGEGERGGRRCVCSLQSSKKSKLTSAFKRYVVDVLVTT